MHGTNITIISICNKQDSWRLASRFLSKIDDKWEHKKILLSLFGGFSELLNSFSLFETTLIWYAKQHNLFQVVIESIFFTDLIDLNSVNIEVPFLSSFKM